MTPVVDIIITIFTFGALTESSADISIMSLVAYAILWLIGYRALKWVFRGF